MNSQKILAIGLGTFVGGCVGYTVSSSIMQYIGLKYLEKSQKDQIEDLKEIKKYFADMKLQFNSDMKLQFNSDKKEFDKIKYN